MHALRGGSQDPPRDVICGRAYDGRREIPCDNNMKENYIVYVYRVDVEVIV